ncbi:MAG: prolipoprotein diacylglyceryl transferase [Bacilli bacterium]|nr:prolipoprotein diacylglyceryl transferase [Bacilli bacterium]
MYTLLAMEDPKFKNIDLFGYKLPTFSFMLGLGIVLFAVVYFFRLRKICVSEKNIDMLTIITLVCGIFTYLGASFFDSLWHAIGDGKITPELLFNFEEGGITFAGGIITGMVAFFLIFPLGMKDDKKHAINYMDQVVIGLLLAHACGRIGCFTAGCCYGLETDSIFGVYHYTRHAYYLPTQLYEAGFLILMFFILFFFVKKYLTEIYLVSYGIFRLLLEFLRGDNRGASPIPFLSPSQFTSIIMILGAIAIFLIRLHIRNKEIEAYHKAEEKPTPKVRYYTATNKGLFKGLFNHQTCPNCNNKMKLGWHKTLIPVNEVELMNSEHLVYICKECNIEQEIK